MEQKHVKTIEGSPEPSDLFEAGVWKCSVALSKGAGGGRRLLVER